MSILIKGNVHLPRSCRDCPFNYSGVCIASANCLKTKSFMKARNPDCPIIEIPTPHGRLIDADRFLDWLKEFHTNDVVIMSGVKNARTVIEAEVSE